MRRNPTLGSMLHQNAPQPFVNNNFTSFGAPTNYGLHNNNLYNEPYYSNQRSEQIEVKPIELEPIKSKIEEYTNSDNMIVETIPVQKTDEISIIARTWWVIILIIICSVCWFKAIDATFSTQNLQFDGSKFYNKLLLALIPSTILLLFMFICGVPVLKVINNYS